MRIIWIVVADESEARVFETFSPKSGLSRVAEMKEPASRLKIREFVSDKPGRVFSSASRVKHGLTSEEDPHVHVERAFAKKLAQQLESHFAKQRFDELVLVAEPTFLGELKAKLPKNIASRVAASVNKDLIHMADHEIDEYLNEVLKKIWSDPRRREIVELLRRY